MRPSSVVVYDSDRAVFNVVPTSDGLRRFGDRVQVPSPLFRTVAIGLGSKVV